MANYPGMFRRGNIWYVRKRIPVDIEDQFPPTKKEIKRSLGTEDKAKAMRLYHDNMAAIERTFERARVMKANPDAHMLSTFDTQDIKNLVYEWYVETIERHDKLERENTKQYSLEEIEESALDDEVALQNYYDARDSNNYERIHSGTQKWLDQKDITYKVGSQSYQEFCYYYIRAVIFMEEKSIAERRGKKFKDLPEIFTEQFKYTTPVNVNSGFTPSKIVTITELAERYLEQNPGMEEKSKRPYKVLARRMNEFFGRDIAIHQISREMLEDFRSALIKLPTHAEKKYPGKAMLKAIALADKENNDKRLSIKTINDQFDLLSTLLNYADQHEGWIQKNYARKMKLRDDEDDEEKRYPFSIEQLNVLFNTPLYRGCKDDEYGQNKPGNSVPRRHKFWVPLVGLYTGMRLNEICQLEVGSIVEINGIYAFELKKKGKMGRKKLKTRTSVRRIPIHEELKKIGFLSFVDQQKKQGYIELFPEIKTGAYGYKSHKATRWFSDFLKYHNIYSEETTFHSFRHSLADALLNGGVDKEVIKALGGWRDTKEAYNVYGSGYAIETLNESLQRAEYKGLDLSHLYKQ